MDELFDQLKELNDSKRFEEAGVLLHKIKESKAKTSQDLMSLATTYGHLGDYKKTVKYFEKAYEKRPSKLLYKEMVELCISCKQGTLAAEYYKTFKDMGVADKATLLEMKYQIQLLLGVPVKEKIETLKAMKVEDYTEVHAIELCKQLYKAGLKEDCIKECENLIMIFEKGPYVDRAKMILAYLNGEITLEELTSGSVKKNVEAKAEEEKQAKQENSSEQEPIKVAEEVNSVEEAEIVEESKATEVEVVEKSKATEAEVVEESKVTEVIESIDTFRHEKISDMSEEKLTKSLKEIMSEPETEEQPKLETYSKPIETVVKPNKVKISNPIPLVENDVKLYETPLKFSIDMLPDGRAKKLIQEKNIDLVDCFKTYILIEDMRRQIIKAIEMGLSQRNTKFFTIDGEESGGKGVLAGRLIKCLNELDIIGSPVAAMLASEELTVELLKKHRDDLKGKSLIIKHAGALSVEVLSEIFKQAGKNGLAAVVLTDTSRSLGTLLRLDPKINEIFNNRIHLTKYNVAERMSFVLDIFREEGYELEETAAGYIEKILSKNTKVESLGAICDYVKKVSENADRRVAPTILQMAKEANYDEQSLIVTIDDLSMEISDQTLN